MANIRSVDFLPEIFQTPVNKQFLAATLDQLIQEPKFQKTQGFVGRRVGPGVNPNDKYVVEPTAVRNEYQLEPGVCQLEADVDKIADVITFPGITDGLNLRGAVTNDSNRLYTSEYYSWDPFVDFDKLVNYNQYYWLPEGPNSVIVSATDVPLTNDYTVNRANGSYTFSGVKGTNPVLTLVRGGSYNFFVAQNQKETVNFRVQTQGISAYVIDYQNNPVLTLARGNTYIFQLDLSGAFPFFIKTVATLGNTNTYDSGVTNNGAISGQLKFTVPQDAPDTLFYVAANEFNMRGQINIVDSAPGTGPGFWIQSEPGINGTLSATPNISSRTVAGVSNNGTDLGTVTFDVPLITAQDFYYNLTDIGGVDFVTTIGYNEINGVTLASFLAQYPNGIDGITSLDNRTVVFNNGTAPTDIYTIRYVTIPGGIELQLENTQVVNTFEKFSILFGTQYANTSWFKNAEGIFEQVPLLTAAQNELWYQDGTDPEIFGRINIINQTQTSTLYIADIIGQKEYTSPNGVVFTNGLKVSFQGLVEPASYLGNNYYVEGVGTAIKLLPVSDYVTPESYIESLSITYDELAYDIGGYDGSLNAPLIPEYVTINRDSPDLNPWSRSNRWFHIDVINATAAYNNTTPTTPQTAKARRPIIEFRGGTKLFNFGTDAITPVDIIDFNTTDALSRVNGQISYTVDGYQFSNGSRVIFAKDTDPDVRNKVYLVEFITPDITPVTTSPNFAPGYHYEIVSLGTTDWNTVAGTTGETYAVGDEIVVVTAAPGTGTAAFTEPVINLVPAEDPTVLPNQSVLVLSGSVETGITWWFDGVDWIEAQQKTAANQPPLFDIYDKNGYSLSDQLVYPSSTFVGTKLFSYAVGTGVKDPVLGFPLKYLSLQNVGDIVFDNNLYKDTFVYVTDAVGNTTPISIGFARQYSDRTTYVKEIGWQTAITKSIDRQQFRFIYDGSPLKLDILVPENNVVPAIQLYVGSVWQHPSNYTTAVENNKTVITLTTTYVPGDIIEIAVISPEVSNEAFYQIPVNLENNPLNENSETFTLGTIRNHYGTIAENLIGFEGPINGANNLRDLGNVVPYGLQILQQSSPLTLAGYFQRKAEYDIFSALEYNNKEYTKFKNLMLETVVRNEYQPTATVAEILDSAIAEITKGRTDINSFYWSDMLPAGSVYTDTVITVNPITNPTFGLTQTYNFTSANYSGLLIYLTRAVDNETELLLRDYDYVVSPDSPNVTVTTALSVGDVVTIREYPSTVGNFVPNTPTKMGLYPSYKPEIFYDSTYVNPTFVIQGHDGSITVAFGDIRDQVLLEFEKRIFDNLKTDDNPIPLTVDEVIPGYFRTTDYSQSEITTILGESFLSWVGWNKIDYKTQDYLANNQFTYNYSSAGNALDGAPLLGAWRGIYRYFYDTETPELTPWEMLGFSQMPTWWEDRYGPAPYTSGNLVLWDDLEAGLVADPVAPYVLPQYRRPGLTQVIPTGSEGQLLSPFTSVMGQYDPTAFRKSWVVGDGGPAEASWWNSSSYPFAVMRLLALTRPAEFFSLFADRDLYRYDAELDQYLFDGRYRLTTKVLSNQPQSSTLVVYGNGVSKASYINWIVDYNQQLGRNSTTALQTDLERIDVRLCYRMASFTDKQYLKIFTERSSPDSVNSSLLLPDESYDLLLYKNQPFAEINYSALIIERVDTGYAVYGYSTIQPYFDIFASSSSGIYQTVSAGGTTVKVPAQYTNTVVQIPYGYVFTNTTVVVDFILSYGKYLESQGLVFNDVENGYTLNWGQMAQEFLYFSQQGWASGTMINLNPAATKLTAVRAEAVADTIVSTGPGSIILGQNRTTIPTKDLIVQRLDNTFTVTTATNQTISYLALRFTNYENMVVLNNVSIFNDLIYNPTTAARQNRVRIVANTTTEWNGQLNAQGFILNQNNVKEWLPGKKYTKGEIVSYKGIYWSAMGIVQPKLEFDYNDWVKSNYDLIQEGLLPNLANKADQLANSYNTQSANLERDNDLLSYGLIGFRPRQYMQDLNLDDTSQVNLYQQFLPTKGTIRAAELFTRADLGKESAEYNIYENWAILVSTYGANANRSFIELRLNEALLPSDPCTVQIIQPQEASSANQTVLLTDIWRSSYKLTSTNILPTTYDTTSDTSLPSAGYVNLDDVDITVFDINDPSSIAASIEKIGIGTLIWAAKSNSYDWNVYRCDRTPGQLLSVSDNLNGTSVATFNTVHNLSEGDLIIIRYFDTAVNGIYRVLSVPSIDSIIIAFSFNNTNQISLSGTGLVFYLQSARVSQASDIATLPYVNLLIPGAKAWVDNNGQGHWEVLEKQRPFAYTLEMNQPATVSGSRYGYSVTQCIENFAALVGAPGTGADAGTVYGYNRNNNGNYDEGQAVILTSADTRGFGTSVQFGKRNWAVAGAPRSYSLTGYAASIYQPATSSAFVINQLLLPHNTDPLTLDPIEFGTSVAISLDEKWMYVGAPAGDRVYAYGRVDQNPQIVQYRTDGVTDTFNYSDSILINSAEPEQIVVVLNNDVLQAGVGYTITATDVVLSSIPAADSLVEISRRELTQLDTALYIGITSTGGDGSGAVFTVNNQRGVYSVIVTDGGLGYVGGNTLTIAGTDIGGTSPANDITISVTSTDSGTITGITFVGNGITNTAVFDLAPLFYTLDGIYSFTVVVDQVVQRPWIDYTFDSGTGQLTFLTVPAAGAIIFVRANTYWQYADTITAPVSGKRFGFSVTTTTDGRQVIIGCPDDNVGFSTGAGSVYVYDRSVVRYNITNTSEFTYAIPGTPVEPISVLLNGVFLTNSNSVPDGQFTVSGSNIVLNSNIGLVIGDVLEIETNEFQLLQQLSANELYDESQFGHAVDICPNNCSIYIGAPYDGTEQIQAGSVERRVNQSRVYGVTTSLIANPTLTVGDTIRINNVEISVPADNTVAGLATAINLANLPNVVASTTTDLTFTGNGSTQIFDIGNLYSVAESYTTVVYVNGVLQVSGVDYTYNSATQQINFVTAPANGTTILVISGRLTLSIKNSEAAKAFNKLMVLPGLVGTTFDDLGFNTYAWTQTITSPNPTSYANFGFAVNVSDDATTLVVGAPHGDAVIPVTFDGGQTYFDDRSTTFITVIEDGGVAFTYDYFPGSSNTIANPGQFAFGQEIYDQDITSNDEFGYSVNYTTGKLLVGSPQSAFAGVEDCGRTDVYNNPTQTPAWTVIHEQQPVVDVDLINSVFMYDKITSATETFFDFIDPLQGKILGVARRNIDYLGAVDPAEYNVGSVHNIGSSWASEHVGEIWWDTDTVRFVDPNQDDITYASRRWAQTFPGSRVDIYQWVASTVPPINYLGEGTPLSTTSYSVNTSLNKQGIIETNYYFWVRGLTTINTGAGKTLSTVGISRYIESPRNSGIPYIAALNSSTIAIYNGLPYISAADTIIHIEYDREFTTANIHQEYQLITSGVADAFLNDTLYRKLLDSFCGTDTAGAPVPDPFLSPGERYGVQFRPRQSMFVDRFLALQNYLTFANRILKDFPIVETKRLTLLKTSEPEPPPVVDSQVIWNKRVANLEELSYQDIYAVPVGYKYLVTSDSVQRGNWAIYEVILLGSVRELRLVQVENYDTSRYWSYIDWYLPGYNSTIQPILEVPNYASLGVLTFADAPVGSSVRVTANGQGKFEIYLRTDLGWDRVGLQDGTIEFSADLWNYAAGGIGYDVKPFDTTGYGFDFEPTIETRFIIRAINEELFVDDLAIERNHALMLMFEYIYTELAAPSWLIKTSLIDVTHKIRGLLPYQTYVQDNQTFVLDYIQEVKPYHVQIREFNLQYFGEDDYPGMLTDFDVPAYWDTLLSVPQYVSPVLLPYSDSGSTVESFNSDTPADAEVWTLNPWKYWFNNYSLSVEGATILNGGTGYTIAPSVVVTGDCTVPAELTAIINSFGQVVGVDVINPGNGYIVTPTVTFVGGNGSGATGYAVMGNSLVRSIKTVIKYDRCEYTSQIVNWEANVPYSNGTLVRYIDRVWEASSPDSSIVIGSIFNFADWTPVDAGTLTATDRTMGLYAPRAEMPGLNLPLLIDGIDYPGVQVYGLGFTQVIPLDAIYESYWGPGGVKVPTGDGYTDINVSGGAYVDTYSSHAPEELIPGAEFDTLDFRVYTTPGSDYTGNGHGFPTASIRYVYDPLNPVLSFAGLLDYPFTVQVFNVTSGLATEVVAYDWVNYTVTVGLTETAGDIVDIYVTGVGGGNQLYLNTYVGSDIGNTVSVPFSITDIYEFLIYNGETQLIEGVDYTYASTNTNQTTVTFATTYGATDRINLATFGYAASGPTYSWSLPVFQTTVANGSSSYTLDNSLQGTNPSNIIVTVNGLRARPSEGIAHTGDGSTTTFGLPTRGGYPLTLIANNDVAVYVDNVPLIVGIDFVVDPYVSSPRTVTFTTAPAVGANILMSVRTAADYFISGNTLTFQAGRTPSVGDLIEIVTWNDTAEQDILTQVFVGPTTSGIFVQQGYDMVDYDSALINDTSGSYDWTQGIQIQSNTFDIGRVITNPERMLVTLNGKWLFNGVGFTVSGSVVTLTGPTISGSAVVSITTFTNSIVPGAMAFRIFQDMRGIQATYRITTQTTTTVSQAVSSTDDIIHVTDASHLGEPNLPSNIWGVCTINGERIMYRERDTVNNTISSLLRGTAGTGAADHAVGADVYDLGVGNLLPEPYQNYIVSNSSLSDGSTLIYTAPDIDVSTEDSTVYNLAVEVYVGGLRVTSGYDIVNDNPVSIVFDTAPPQGEEVTILVRRGVDWYNPATPDAPLQDTDTAPARFLRGL